MSSVATNAAEKTNCRAVVFETKPGMRNVTPQEKQLTLEISYTPKVVTFRIFFCYRAAKIAEEKSWDFTLETLVIIHQPEIN